METLLGIGTVNRIRVATRTSSELILFAMASRHGIIQSAPASMRLAPGLFIPLTRQRILILLTFFPQVRGPIANTHSP